MLKEWAIGDFSMEYFRRTYEKEDIEWKYERLFKYYQDSYKSKPKICIKEFNRIL